MHNTRPTVALRLRDVTKQYNARSRGIESITLDVMAGEVFGFLGPNGAGKSTTINVMLDLLRPQTGTIELFGVDHRKRPALRRRQIGYLSGDMETDPTLTGRQYLHFVANIRGGVKQSTIGTLTDRLQCDLDKKIRHLSRGNKQKIGLVAALMHDPDLLILDEPTSGLDPLIQAEFNAIIREHQARGKTTFISSHVLSEVQAICDRVGFIRDGKLIKVSNLDDLIREATKHVTATFVKTVPKNSLINLPGAHNVIVDGQTASLHFKGNDNDLLRLLSAHSLKDVQISEPDLSDLFMDYYQTEGAHDA